MLLVVMLCLTHKIPDRLPSVATKIWAWLISSVAASTMGTVEPA